MYYTVHTMNTCKDHVNIWMLNINNRHRTRTHANTHPHTYTRILSCWGEADGKYSVYSEEKAYRELMNNQWILIKLKKDKCVCVYVCVHHKQCVCVLTGAATWAWSWCSGCVSSVCTCAVGLLLCVSGRCCWSWESCCLVKTQPHTHTHTRTHTH